jgi:hypothetical protein
MIDHLHVLSLRVQRANERVRIVGGSWYHMCELSLFLSLSIAEVLTNDFSQVSTAITLVKALIYPSLRST